MQPTKTSELYWYAVHVRSRHEFKVLDRLTKAGIDTFLPVVERLNKWKDRKKLVNFPLFPGYLFKKLIENKEAIDPYPYLKEGQRVRIKRGPLRGVEGILVERPGQHLLVISVDILRQGVSIKIDASDVEKA